MERSKSWLLIGICLLVFSVAGIVFVYMYQKEMPVRIEETDVPPSADLGSEENTAQLTGTITYRERVALPSGSVVEIELREISDTDIPVQSIVRQSLTTQGENVPLSFVLSYDATRIDPSRVYTIFAQIRVDGNVRWMTTEEYQVLTYENALDNVTILLRAVEKSSDDRLLNDRLNGSAFRLVSYNGTAVPTSESYILSFTDNRLNAKFCNTMEGEIILENGVLSSVLASTLMSCTTPANVMMLEQQFSALIATGASLVYEGSAVILTQGQQRFVFEKQ